MLFLLLLLGTGGAPPVDPTIPISVCEVRNGGGSVVGLTDGATIARGTITRTTVFGFVMMDCINIPSFAGGFIQCATRPDSSVALAQCATRPASTLTDGVGARP